MTQTTPMEQRRRNVVPWVWELHIEDANGKGYVFYNEHRNRRDAREAARNFRAIFNGQRTRVVKAVQPTQNVVAQVEPQGDL